jgi:predicted phosphodiesterase
MLTGYPNVPKIEQSQKKGYVENLMLPPEERLEPYINDVEKKAYATVNNGETLIFGHTHRPFVSNDHKLVNTGSWVSDADIHNTFVEIEPENADLKIFQFEDEQTIRDITTKLSYSLN